MAKKGKKPGMVVYHDLLGPLEMVPDEVAGQIFKAALRYSAEGEKVEFERIEAQMLWKMISANIDRDSEAYAKRCADNAYAGYKSARERRKQEVLTREEWDERRRTLENSD